MAKRSVKSAAARRARRQAAQKRKQRTRLMTYGFGAIILVGLVLLVREVNAPSLDDIVIPSDLSTPASADGTSWGPVDAPVLVEEFSDFQ